METYERLAMELEMEVEVEVEVELGGGGGLEMEVEVEVEVAMAMEMEMEVGMAMAMEMVMDEFLRTIYYHNLVSTHIPVPYDHSIKFTSIPDANPFESLRPTLDLFQRPSPGQKADYGKGLRDDCGTSQGTGTSIEPCGYFDGTSDLRLPF